MRAEQHPELAKLANDVVFQSAEVIERDHHLIDLRLQLHQAMQHENLLLILQAMAGPTTTPQAPPHQR